MRLTLLRGRIQWAIGLAAALVALTAALTYMRPTFGLPPNPFVQKQEWPAFTMTYKKVDTSVSIGDKKLQIPETHVLKYQSENHWADTVVASEPFDTAQGSASRIGSYLRANGTTLTEYDANMGFISTSTIKEGTTATPNGYIMPWAVGAMLQAEMASSSVVTLPIRICYQGKCKEPVEVLSVHTDFANASGYYTEDSFHIALGSAGSPVTVTELDIQAPKS